MNTATTDPGRGSALRWLLGLPRRMYDWTLSWAHTPYGAPALFVLAFFEASFFPIPPDVLLMALALERRRRALLYAVICTVGSVSGALLGWYIGASLWASLGTAAACPEFGGGAWLFDHVPGFKCAHFAKVEDAYHANGAMALFVAAFTPIPFKVFTIAAGVFKVGIPTLLLGSTAGRAARFFLVAGLIYGFGPPIRKFIEKRFELVTLVFGTLLVAGFAVVKYVL